MIDIYTSYIGENVFFVHFWNNGILKIREIAQPFNWYVIEFWDGHRYKVNILLPVFLENKRGFFLSTLKDLKTFFENASSRFVLRLYFVPSASTPPPPK